MGKILRLGIVLFIITAVTGLILGGVYTMTQEPIRVAKERERIDALTATLPGATTFKTMEIIGNPGHIKEINRGTANGELIGYNFTMATKGYGGLIEMIAGVSKEGKLMAIKIISHSETPGLGAKANDESFLSQFREKMVSRVAVTKTGAANDSEIQAISGATITSQAVALGVNDALAYFKEHRSDMMAGGLSDDVTGGAQEQKPDEQEDDN